jgi:prophage DNA circulation protein
MEDALARLDKLTQDEVRMVAAQVLKSTHGVDDRVAAVDDNVQGVRNDVQGVSNQVQTVDERVNTVLDSAFAIFNILRTPS